VFCRQRPRWLGQLHAVARAGLLRMKKKYMRYAALFVFPCSSEKRNILISTEKKSAQVKE